MSPEKFTILPIHDLLKDGIRSPRPHRSRKLSQTFLRDVFLELSMGVLAFTCRDVARDTLHSPVQESDHGNVERPLAITLECTLDRLLEKIARCEVVSHEVLEALPPEELGDDHELRMVFSR